MAVLPETTLAVSVISVPAATLETELPPALTVRVVDVADRARTGCAVPQRTAMQIRTGLQRRSRDIRTFFMCFSLGALNEMRRQGETCGGRLCRDAAYC